MDYFQILSLILTIAFFMLTAYFLFFLRKHDESRKSLTYYKKLCDELDQNARLIIKQDRKLTQRQERLDKQVHALYALHKLGQKIGTVLDETVLSDLVNNLLIHDLELERSAIFMRLRDSSQLLCIGSHGFVDQALLDEMPESLEQALQKSPSGALGYAGTPDNLLKKIASQLSLDTFAIIPILLKKEIVGVILAGNTLPQEKVEEPEKEILDLLSDQVSVVLENCRLYEQIRQSHHHLETRVQERTHELAKMNEELKRISEMKSDFVSSASHELRTPLTSIKGYASILIAEKLGKVTSEQKKRLEKINSNANELVEMINTLLDISRIERGKTEMKLEPCSLEELINKIIDLLQPQYLSNKVTSDVKLPEKLDPILADAKHLQRVFINLIGNALKYSPTDGTGVISVEVSSKKDPYTISISDNGVGIPEESLPKLFTEFYRVDTPMNQEIKGTGLGLSLAKQIVEAHNGKIWVDSQVGKKTTFYFTIPRAR